MQTFFALPDLDEAAAVLDRQRLGKQRVENLQIMKALLDPSYGWQTHPAVRMWRGYELGLMDYHRAIISEWVGRGYRDTCWEKLTDLWIGAGKPGKDLPPWVGDPEFHRAQQSNLIRKMRAHYEPLFPGVPDNLPYVWPVKENVDAG